MSTRQIRDLHGGLTSTVSSLAGSQLFISESILDFSDLANDSLATNSEALTKLDALTWVEIGGLSQVPSSGRTYNPVDFKFISNPRLVRVNGAYSYTDATIMYEDNPADAGQIILNNIDVEKDSNKRFMFKFIKKPQGVEYISYATAIISNIERAGGDADTVMTVTTTLMMHSDWNHFG